MNTKQARKIFQVRPKNAIEREKLIIGIFVNGYSFRSSMIKDDAILEYPNFQFFLDMPNVKENSEVEMISNKYAEEIKSECPIKTVDEAIKWMQSNHGPFYTNRGKYL